MPITAEQSEQLDKITGSKCLIIRLKTEENVR